MKESFREKLHLSKSNIEKLKTVNSILEEYKEEGYRLTLRQLYYQLVSRDIVPNQQKEYAKLSTLLVKGRMAGLVDWDIIEDRVRVPYIEYSVSGIPAALEDTIDQYKLNRLKDQDVYIELWVEKDALSGVLKRMTDKYHIKLMVNRGYSSASAMYDAYRRIKVQVRDFDRRVVILYLGDHDPSGLDMIRDIRDRLNEFGVTPEVRQIGLTMEQIKEFSPPPNPAKITDPRAKGYIENFGNTSWEVDALNPKTLHKLVKENVEGLIDIDKYNNMLVKEKLDQRELKRLMGEF